MHFLYLYDLEMLLAFSEQCATSKLPIKLPNFEVEFMSKVITDMSLFRDLTQDKPLATCVPVHYM